MIEKIKVTKQEIRTYETNGRIMNYTFSESFLNSLLGRKGKYEISDKNTNVTWYTKASLSESKKVEYQNDESIESDIITILENDGYIVTESVKDIVNEYSIKDLKEHSKKDKISLHTLKAIDKAND
jgi:hypothetical protein